MSSSARAWLSVAVALAWRYLRGEVMSTTSVGLRASVNKSITGSIASSLLMIVAVLLAIVVPWVTVLVASLLLFSGLMHFAYTGHDCLGNSSWDRIQSLRTVA